MKTPVIIAAALIATAVAAPARAQAFDFTITVPVNVSGIPANVTDVSVSCDIMPENYGDGRNQIAHGVRSAKLTGGAFHDNLVVTMNAAPGKDPSLGRWYQCRAAFLGTDRGVSTIFFLNGPTSPPIFPLVAGAPLYLGNLDRWIRIPGIAH